MIEGVLFDAFGTLVHLEPPAPRLQRSLARRLGIELTLDRCSAGMQAELRYYGSNCSRAHDEASLAVLRLECADVLADALAAGPNGPELLPCLTDAIAFVAYPDSAPALAALRSAGRRLAVVSNWDVSLAPVFERLGLLEPFETVVISAQAGASKPDPRPFQLALARLSLAPEACIHVGDHEVNDGEGARAAGIVPIIVDRGGTGGSERRVRSLLELPDILVELDAA